MNNTKSFNLRKINRLSELDKKLAEADEDIMNGKLHDLKSVMLSGLCVIERKLKNYSIGEQKQAIQFINEMRQKFE